MLLYLFSTVAACTFDQANISIPGQRCFNVVNQRWNNLDLMLKIKQNPKSVFQCYPTLIMNVLHKKE